MYESLRRLRPALEIIVLWFATFGPAVRQLIAAEPVHAYLRGENVVEYSIEAGPRAFVRRVTGGVLDDKCQLARVPLRSHLPKTVDFPIRIKEAGPYCWSVWPAEEIASPHSLPRSTARYPLTPDFLCLRLDSDKFTESTISLNDLYAANLAAEVSTIRVNAKFARDYPISAMFRSKYVDLIEVDGAPRHASRESVYPVDPYSAKFADWAKRVQGELNRFASYDLIADKDGGCRLFLVMEGSENRRYILPPSEEKRMYELQAVPATNPFEEWSWRVDDHYPSDFVARFYVVESYGQRWFVTGEGELYRLASHGDEKAVRQVKVRDDQPIRVLLEESGNPARCFAFTTTRWFEVNEPLEYHDFALGAVQAESPMPTLLRCAAEARKQFPAILTTQ